MSEEASKIIGRRIKETLEEQGKTQAWLAHEMGIQPGYLSELINVHPQKRWNIDLLASAADILGVELSQITGEKDDEYIALLRKVDDPNLRQKVKDFVLEKFVQKKAA